MMLDSNIIQKAEVVVFWAIII